MGITGPGWLGWLFAVVMLGTAAYCAGRLAVAWRSRRPTGYAVDLTHVLMGTAMAGMLVPGLGFAPAGLWQVTFAATGCWFAAQAVRGLTRGGAVRWRASSRPAVDLSVLARALRWRGAATARQVSRRAGRRSSARGRQNPAQAGPAPEGTPRPGRSCTCWPAARCWSCWRPRPAARRGGRRTAAGGGPLPVLAILCAVGLLASVVLATDRLTVLAPVPAAAPAPRGGAGVPMSLRLAACCDIAVGRHHGLPADPDDRLGL